MANSKIMSLRDEYYKVFKGLPSYGPIVRNRQKDDAFELVVLNVLYGKLLDLTFDVEHIDELAKYVIAPPDGGIDLFVEKASGDEFVFDVVQVKNQDLDEAELKTIFASMERIISDFCKNDNNVKSETCRDTLNLSNLDKNNKSNCQYYIVHTGDTKDFAGLKDNEHILNIIDLEILSEGSQDKVEEDVLTIAGKNKYLAYDEENEKQNAIICNINAYDLAVLSNKYYSTEIGRNILFGHNLRESLSIKSSKSYGVMEKTIEQCPTNFWYYNNGITIVAEGVEPDAVDDKTSIKLSKFSIVNGAQTTSSLGLILQTAKRKRDNDTVEALKKAFVMARILKVSDVETENAIAIYNNTQNPINNRDMVANNVEQKKLSSWLLDETYPQIFVEIRRGSRLPNSFNKSYVHRKTSNETLAQLAYAGFYIKPYTAKDKKSALFFNDTSQTEFTLNEVYHKIFNYDENTPDENGILFKKTKNEIDELLFVHQLYKEGKNHLRKSIQKRLSDEQKAYDEADNDGKASIMPRIERDEAMLETVGVCLFYFVAAYYELSMQNTGLCRGKRYDFDKYYQDKQYKESLITDSANLFLMKTIEIINKNAKENGKATNMNNWIRGAQCERKFLETLRYDIGYDVSLQKRFEEFINKYKVVPQ